ncbi:hypothetical protein ETAA8_71160 [Anatilimnocola aggregata]|uniref:DUF4340 domain-containing protein n=1 Tax=Anatilimnocola aggregata TaxID=2528021 RepID=A0A517YP10_9BACT|nr:DUF4340 domain-containing protein [Anatilimnocola aggregata]QDU31954.1 hypothetical protein ETAA8_71160 [Anatilimnocola aggregata]
MNEKTRTLIHVAIAGFIAVVVGIEIARTRPVDTTGDPTKTAFFPDFKDPLTAKSLEILKFDEKLAQMTPFKVADVKGRWAIPSRDNYPADAQDRLRDASLALIDLKPLDVASEIPEDHQEYGVIEPVKGKTKAGDEGVGTLITVQDTKGNDLFRLIVGKAASAEGDNLGGLRFVRKPGEDIVYVAKIDLTKLPTEFDQWIEKDLLKLNALDVAKVTLKDYNVLPSGNGRYSRFPRMDAVVSWNTEKGEWKLDELTRFSRNQPVADGLGEQEELNKQKLDDLKTALDDLKIVDVQRKPAGLDAELKLSPELMANREGLVSLQELGFYPVGRNAEENTLELASANGEVIIDMKDGVQYKLRFGNVASEVATADGTMNRHLFVSAQVAPDVLTPPKLEAEPAGPEPAPAEKPAPTDKPADPKGDEKKSGGGGDDPSSCQEEPKVDDKPAAKDPAAADDAGKPGPAPVVDPNKAEIERIRKENRRKMEDWEERKKKATGRVAELNARFSDWYYVISEDVYKKIHLSRADIVKETTGSKDEGFGIESFRKLETEGIKTIQPSPPPGGPGGPGGFPGGGFNPGGFNP